MRGILPLLASAILCAAIESWAAASSATVTNAPAGRRPRLTDDERHAAVTPLANRLIHRQSPEKGNVHRRGERFASPMPEDIRFVVIIGAGVVAHVLDESNGLDVQLLIHPDRAPRVSKRYLLGRGDQDGTGNRHGLAEA